MITTTTTMPWSMLKSSTRLLASASFVTTAARCDESQRTRSDGEQRDAPAAKRRARSCRAKRDPTRRRADPTNEATKNGGGGSHENVTTANISRLGSSSSRSRRQWRQRPSARSASDGSRKARAATGARRAAPAPTWRARRSQRRAATAAARHTVVCCLHCLRQREKGDRCR